MDQRLPLGIVSTDPIRAEGLLSIFDGHPSVHAYTAELRSLLEEDTLGYILLDVSTTDAWIDTLFFVRRLRPDIRQIVLGPSTDEDLVQRSIIAGGRAYLDVCCEPEQVIMALEAVLQGSIWAPRRTLSKLIDRLLVGSTAHQKNQFEKLSRRERQVLDRILEARSNREIAEDLGIEERTVKAYVSSLMRKTGVQNRVALSMLAVHDATARDQAFNSL
jgi:DNA-binding NarL/FixJ family response regulator